MFQKNKATRNKTAMTGTGLVFEPRNFGDPVAEQTDWSPLVRGGTNFRTRKLKETGSQILAFKPTIFALIFALIFFLLGSFMALVSISGLILNGFTNDRGIFLALGLLFGSGGGFMWYIFTMPIVFDTERGFFWRGHTQGQLIDHLDIYCPLKGIHALQLISEQVERSNSDDYSFSRRYYHSFELNLISHSGARINVVDHGDYKALRRDADRLAVFLAVPLWDACG